MHGFNNNDFNFPPEAQNQNVYVINPTTGTVYKRSLTDPSSGLSQQQIDSLSVTSPQSYQESTTLFMTGGYGYDTATATYTTKPILTAINVPGLIQWVTEPNNLNVSVVENIRQISNPIFQIAGGEMLKIGNLTQLVFGQNFTGPYYDSSNGVYSEQVRLFHINGTNGQLSVDIYGSQPSVPNPIYRRRDLNVVPIIRNNNNLLQYGLAVYGGVFTLTGGVWTVPVVINESGIPSMVDAASPSSFKQAMNQYTCANTNFYSRKYQNMYSIFLGGISLGYFQNGSFTTDNEVPFINQVTTIQMDKNGHFTQYLMDGQYPLIPSTGANPGNPLLFGAGAYFIPNNLTQYPNGVLNLDSIRKPTVIGYVVGGIASTVPNTNSDADSSASPYVFQVTLLPK